PNVVAVHDVGTFEDGVFVAMDFVQGQTLRAWLRERTHSWKQILDLFLQAGRGLAAAHRAGIVHRDFKPDNVLVDVEGRVRVTDFGLARAVGAENEPMRPSSARAPGPLALELTRTGMLVGTPAYMAPEQFSGGAVDPRT